MRNNVDDKIQKLKREYYKKYRDANKDKINQYQREYRQKNKDKVRQYNKTYWLKQVQKIESD